MHEVVVEGTGIPEALPLHERPFLWLASRWPGRVFRTLAMPAVRYEIRRRVGGFVEIRRTNDPAQIVDQLRQESSRTGVGAEINLVVEAAATDEEAAKALAWYKGAVVAGASRVAIKPTALVPLSGSAVATTPSSGKLAAALKDIFRIADERRDADNVSVTEISIDSERSDILDMTRIAVLAVAAAYPRVRVKMAMQAYLRDTESRLLDPFLDASARRVREGGVPLGARLVCGANTEGEELLASQMGWDSTPLVSSRSATHANYFRLMRRMLKPILKGEFTVTHASMNVVTVAHHLVELAKAGVFASEHSGAVSFAMLRGMMGQGIFRVLTERYGVQCHEYVPVISRDRVVELFKYYLRRIEEIAGSNPEHATANYLGLTCAFGADSDQWRSTQVEHGFLAALGLDDRQEQEGAYPLKPGVQPNRGEHEPFVSDEASEFRITPALNAGAEDTRLWIEARSRACVDREERDAPRIRPLWYDKRTRETRVLMGPTRPELVLAVADMATKEDIDRAFEIAEMDRTGWGVKPMLDRLAILSAAEREIASTREKLVECLMLDAGKSVTEADAEVDETRDFLRLTVRQWKALLARDQLVVSPGGNGTAVVVCPKNFPQAIPAAHVRDGQLFPSRRRAGGSLIAPTVRQRARFRTHVSP
jgi:RHH-type proline utilization regulon transcriptional repressor/proline dehydrogenase/delta 1-pyrroline-5-carboxylate dehydrogenase